MERDFSVFDEGVTVSTLSMLKELASESKDLLHAQESMFNQRNEADLNKMAAQGMLTTHQPAFHISTILMDNSKKSQKST